jgi:hypothetical protein
VPLEGAAIEQHLSALPQRDRTCLVGRLKAKIASRQEKQPHMSNVREDGNLVHHRHKMPPKSRSQPNIYGVQVVAGSNPVTPI